ncbi:MAG: YqaE/Pmp3 family membrane protein, partial [Peptostreptococcaceae bacterium]
MLYFLAVICPPVAVLLRGKPIQSLFNLLLTLLGWIPGVIHAILVVNKANADKRHKEMVKAIKKN